MRRPLFPAMLPLTAIALLALTGCGSTATASHTAPASVAATPAKKSAEPDPSSTTASSAKAEPEYNPKADAAADIAVALKSAKKDGHPVLVDFGADWCMDCRVLGARFKESGPSALLAEYHVVRVDVGNFDHNLDVAARYVDLRTSGIPALVVLDPTSGQAKVATNKGEFSNARTMSADQVQEFLKRWK
ncbi:thioredoxin family protein [Streptomyces sp. NPDC059378]|uniref:thioredoxin family protein n=1 Tax=Streptomyces sp. NPDC059378 TaxID=3346815 RepID=UPI00367FE42E